LKKLIERGLVESWEETREAALPALAAAARPAQLTAHQSAAAATLAAALDAGGFHPFLLRGVTGSGKTEVYLSLVERALARGLGSLVLVPEIALTPQLVGRFAARFGSQVALLHSALSDTERLRQWQALRSGRVKIAVGVRSAIFAPVQQLSVLVVDEEHDGSFKQEEKLRYQARDLALVRGKQSGAVVVLGSATPSLESWENVKRGRYKLLELPERVDGRALPAVTRVDLRSERPRWGGTEEPPVLGPTSLQALEEVLSKKQQAIVFLNRRGHSTFLLCEVCGETVKCAQCDVSLTHHLSARTLLCHYCGIARPVPEACGQCRGPLLKLGFGTEKVEEELRASFPQSRVARLDRDASHSAQRLTEILSAFARREVDVLVGTQMVAKGHDFPGVTLVIAAMADTALALPDFRAAERTFQVLTQVAGRAGRGGETGRVILQTYNPEAPPVYHVVAHDFLGFAEYELGWRKALAYPPFCRMVALRLESEKPNEVEAGARLLGRLLARHLPGASEGVRLLGPAPAPIAKIKGKTRWQLLLKGPTHASLSRPLAAVESALERLPSSVKLVVDVDPGALL
jgi:primosomal protein N' (replication factor Y)